MPLWGIGLDNLGIVMNLSIPTLSRLAASLITSAVLCFGSVAMASPGDLPSSVPPLHDFMLGGSFSPIYQGPYAFILMQTDTDGARCSGVLVGTREVLTAGHCIVSPSGETQFSAPDYTVVVGGETYNVTQTDFNSSYDPNASVDDNSSQFDMGMLTLDRDVTGTAPVPVLRGAPVKSGDTETLFGFGTNENSTTGQNTLQSLLDQGKSGTLRISSASGGVLHSSHTNSLVVSCAGDSGGPLVRLPSTAHRAVVGLVSAGTTGNASNGVCTTSGPDDLSIFVNTQSTTALNFLAQFSRVQYLTPGFIVFKASVDRAITALKKVQSSTLTSIRKQAKSSETALKKLVFSADSARLPTLLSAITKIQAAKSAKRTSNAQKSVKQAVNLLKMLSTLGID